MAASEPSPPPRLHGLSRPFYDRHPLIVAPELIGKLVVAGPVVVRVVEVEAYCGADDPGSHGFRGRTERNAVMFGPPGHLYVYFTYGMHFCANVVTAPDGGAGAVLLRGALSVQGVQLMQARRGGRADLCDGPAKLCQALAVGREHNGLDLCSRRAAVYLADDGTEPPPHVTTPRIGLSPGRGDDLPWRFVAATHPAVTSNTR